MLVYRMNVLQALKDKGYNSGRILREKQFGQGDVQKMRDNVVLGINGINKLCYYLERQPGAIFRYIPDDYYEALKESDALKDYEIVTERRKKS